MKESELLEKISFNVIQGRITSDDEGIDEGLEGQPAVVELVNNAIEMGMDAKSIMIDSLTNSMGIVGEKFETGEFLIPDMLASAECVGAAMEILKPHLVKKGVKSKGKFVIATVAGDLHDIGKNIVSILLKGEGYEIIDLGNDVSSQTIVDSVLTHNAPFLGLSALLTTTMQNMKDVIDKLVQANIRDKVKVFIGGAPTSKEFAEKIGADAYCNDAFQAVSILRRDCCES
ncbi:MAG: corrinoid protein [Desulfobacterales bacterium]|nr:corrinoid protein [Desulfobacterales bacterium]